MGNTVELEKIELKPSSSTVQTWQLKANPEPPVPDLAKEGAGASFVAAPITWASKVHPSHWCRLLHFLKFAGADDGAGYIQKYPKVLWFRHRPETGKVC